VDAGCGECPSLASQNFAALGQWGKGLSARHVVFVLLAWVINDSMHSKQLTPRKMKKQIPCSKNATI